MSTNKPIKIAVSIFSLFLFNTTFSAKELCDEEEIKVLEYGVSNKDIV